MLQNIVFQDNLYQLSQSLDTLSEGLMLELQKEYFFDKIVDDILFFDNIIQKMYKQIQMNPNLGEYTRLLRNLYSCQERYIKIIDSILQGQTAMKESFIPLMPKLQTIRNLQRSIREQILKEMQKGAKNTDARDIVSSNELNELLNF
ncbi:hypothetical protein K7I13_01755 [Brucepastera parasyntrophica]|uniref:hypothetical protein n=1 Tax=Brucepastera parasyntrophica TaxID=2880008 RepID=UPI00210B0DB9|nr:hypothetical protein [Brucepastera parasyntrophica]ULQ60079.1 hypothetical protein K7I13_01755 [Brucepastera parasyntrophica]